MKILLIGIGVLVAILAIIVIAALLIGRRLPERHTATVTREIAAPLARVAAIIRDVEQQPSWRGGLKRIEVTARGDSLLRYVEHGSNGAIPFAFQEAAEGTEFRSVIDTDSLPFGGQWTITLTAIDHAHTKVSIREDGIVRSALFRFVSTYLMGHTRTIDGYLQDLAATVAQ
jgi:uncharacterized protein YndB with AHSA1/START domain